MTHVFWLELLVLGSIALFQLLAYFKTARHIAALRDVFPSGRAYRLVAGVFQQKQLDDIEAETIREILEKDASASVVQFFPDEQDTGSTAAWVEVKLISGDHDNPTYLDLRRDVNIYLVRNKNHSTDFKIIRDIAERYCESEGNLAESALNMPLYLGLLGTMTGVVVGALHLGLSTDLAINDVGVLLQTVGLSMSVSVLGLLLTIFNANSCRAAQRQMESGKNQFFTFVQTELLPTLSNDTERSLDKLQSNLDNFNRNFGKHLNKFNEGIGGVRENLQLQKAMLDQLERIGLGNMVHSFGRIAHDVTKSADAFGQFQTYQALLSDTFASFQESVQTLDSLYRNTEHFTTDLALVADNIRQQHVTYDRILTVLDENYTEVEARRQVIVKMTDELDRFVREQFTAFQKNTQRYSESFGKTHDQHLGTVRQTYESLEAFLKQKSGEMQALSEVEIKALEEAYRARHQHFDHLGRLPNIERTLGGMTTHDQQHGMFQLLLSNLMQLAKQLEEQNRLLCKSQVVASNGWFVRLPKFFFKSPTPDPSENDKT